MLSERELESSPLFRNITYEEYLRMLTCFQAVQKSYPTFWEDYRHLGGVVDVL